MVRSRCPNAPSQSSGCCSAQSGGRCSVCPGRLPSITPWGKGRVAVAVTRPLVTSTSTARADSVPKSIPTVCLDIGARGSGEHLRFETQDAADPQELLRVVSVDPVNVVTVVRGEEDFGRDPEPRERMRPLGRGRLCLLPRHGLAKLHELGGHDCHPVTPPPPRPNGPPPPPHGG